MLQGQSHFPSEPQSVIALPGSQLLVVPGTSCAGAAQGHSAETLAWASLTGFSDSLEACLSLKGDVLSFCLPGAWLSLAWVGWVFRPAGSQMLPPEIAPHLYLWGMINGRNVRPCRRREAAGGKVWEKRPWGFSQTLPPPLFLNKLHSYAYICMQLHEEAHRKPTSRVRNQVACHRKS